ncbi:hypothetical protein [Microcoleus sp. Pol12B5]|uniref:hypothetical protein n=1 Tax=Microcoleus sp. Pol12B5 TaxID=3055396 RepID=UPI002FD28B4A
MRGFKLIVRTLFELICKHWSREFIDGSQLLTEQIYCQVPPAVAPFTPWLCQAWLCQVSTIEVSIKFFLAGNLNNLLEMQVSEL